MKHGKKYLEAVKKIDKTKKYTLNEAVSLIKQISYVKFNESVDVSIRLGVDPKHADQQVRGTVVLPSGIGKKIRVVVFVKGEKRREAEESGADFIGDDDLINKIKGGWTDFDAAVASPDMMKDVGKLGKILGPRGLMPNPKLGTVTNDVAGAIRELKAGKIEFRVDKNANIHCTIGKISFNEDQLRENLKALLTAIQKSKPSSSKGQYFRHISISTTMSPSIKIDQSDVMNLFKQA